MHCSNLCQSVLSLDGAPAKVLISEQLVIIPIRIMTIKSKIINYLQDPTEDAYFNLTENSLPVNEVLSIVEEHYEQLIIEMTDSKDNDIQNLTEELNATKEKTRNLESKLAQIRDIVFTSKINQIVKILNQEEIQ